MRKKIMINIIYSIDDIERIICNTINKQKYGNIKISITNEMD